MPNPRPFLIACGGGAALGALAWVAFSGGRPAARPMDLLEARLAGMRTGAPRHAPAPPDRIAQILAAPLFALTTGPGAVKEAGIRLEGLARSPGHVAALISIDGQPADWLALGATRDGVTLREVLGSKIVLDTATGFREVGFGDAPAAPARPQG